MLLIDVCLHQASLLCVINNLPVNQHIYFFSCDQPSLYEASVDRC
jgi:hypothetical protein